MFRDEGGTFVGRCGLHRWRFEELDEVELGYVVRSDLWGQGYATEMGAAVMSYAAEALGLNELVGFTMTDNPRSQRVLEKLGFTFERAFVDDGEELVLYRRDLDDVLSRPEGSFTPGHLAHRNQDQRDFGAAAPRLDPAQRRWLRDTLERVHPGHHWLDGLK
jgi:hypothetical protein